MKVRVGLRLLAVAGAMAAASGLATVAQAGDPGNAFTLFQLTNQDRTSNGLGALGFNSGLASIATGQRGSCGGTGINGRSQDLIERNYFSHQIPPCGGYVWQVFSLGAYTAAGENIGWNNYPPDQSVGQINTAFMNSPEHRANILGNYNQLGTGAWQASGPWSGAGGPYNNVIM
ncbi:MAG TPA: CAP domain-containing protein, partial [Candidatus Dormibacteraeota bacterium]